MQSKDEAGKATMSRSATSGGRGLPGMHLSWDQTNELVALHKEKTDALVGWRKCGS